MKRPSFTNIIAGVVLLFVGRCTADLPPPPDPFVFCAAISNLEGK